eukprot:891964-Rhodomonas_salina.1
MTDQKHARAGRESQPPGPQGPFLLACRVNFTRLCVNFAQFFVNFTQFLVNQTHFPVNLMVFHLNFTQLSTVPYQLNDVPCHLNAVPKLTFGRSQGDFALLFAAKSGHAPAISALLAAKPDINLQARA